MRSTGEMLFLEPVTGSSAVYAHRYMSPFFDYLTAWSYLVYVDGGADPGDYRYRGVCQFWFRIWRNGYRH